MIRTVRTLFAMFVGCAALLVSACRTLGPSALRPAYSEALPTTARADRWHDSAIHDEVLAQFQVPSLRTMQLPAGVEELRASTGGGMVNYPVPLLRVVKDGKRTRGEVYVFWLSPSDSAARAMEAMEFATYPFRNNGCRPLVRSRRFSACRLQGVTPATWARVARALDSLKAWEIPHPDAMPSLMGGRHVTDSPSMLLERRHGSGYQSGRYDPISGYGGPFGRGIVAVRALVEQSKTWR